MTTASTEQNNGLIGLSVLALMTLALISGQAVSNEPSAADVAPLFERPTATNVQHQAFPSVAGLPAMDRARGAIREIRVIPSRLADRPEFGWKADDSLIREYCDLAC